MCACAPSVFILYKNDLKEVEKLRRSLNFSSLETRESKSLVPV